MPEEINRLVTDAISDWFFCTEKSGVDHLLAEGKSPDVVFFVDATSWWTHCFTSVRSSMNAKGNWPSRGN